MENTMEYPTKELRVKKSEHTHQMSFNEWSDKLGVSTMYVEPTPYFQGNPPNCYSPKPIVEDSFITKLIKALFL